MALGFVDLDKAFDTITREIVMATLRWMGVPTSEVRMVVCTYEKTTSRVVVRENKSGGGRKQEWWWEKARVVVGESKSGGGRKQEWW